MTQNRTLDADRMVLDMPDASGIIDPAAFPPDHGAEFGAHQIYSMLITLWTPAIVEAAHDLGLWPALAAGVEDVDGLAKELGADAAALDSLLRALEVLALVEYDPALGYRLTPGIAQYLVPGGPWSMAGKMTHDLNVAWPAWRGLADMVRRGPSSGESPADNQIGSRDYVDLVPSLNFMAPPAVAKISSWLRENRWQQHGTPRRMLDIGCGSGIYSQIMLSEWPALTSVGMDVPEVAGLAREHIGAHGAGDRFSTRDGDFWETGWPPANDLILVANILHTRSEPQARRLVRATAEAVAPDGVVAFVDMFDADGSNDDSRDRFAALFAMSMLATGGGGTYSVERCADWIREAGMTVVAVLDNPINRTVIAAPAGHA